MKSKICLLSVSVTEEYVSEKINQFTCDEKKTLYAVDKESNFGGKKTFVKKEDLMKTDSWLVQNLVHRIQYHIWFLPDQEEQARKILYKKVKETSKNQKDIAAKLWKHVSVLKFLLLMLLIAPQASEAQVSKKIGAYISFAVAGACDGIAESVKFHKLGEGHPFWDAKTSWQNKWKNGDPNQGEKFFGSSTLFVRTQDGYHLARGVRNDALVLGITFAISGGEKKKFVYYLIDAVLYMVCYRAGFASTYYTTGKRN